MFTDEGSAGDTGTGSGNGEGGPEESLQASEPTRGDEAPRVFLVVVDESEELDVALHFACLRARKTGGRVAMLYVQEPIEFHHWLGVGEIIQQERRDEAETRLQELSDRAQRLSGTTPMLLVREGKRAEELFKLLEEDPTISVVVLGVSAKSEGPGPILHYIMNKAQDRLRTPITIVPGTLTLDEVEKLA